MPAIMFPMGYIAIGLPLGEPGQITGQVIVDNTKPQAPRLISPRVGANLTSEPELFWEGAEGCTIFWSTLEGERTCSRGANPHWHT